MSAGFRHNPQLAVSAEMSEGAVAGDQGHVVVDARLRDQGAGEAGFEALRVKYGSKEPRSFPVAVEYP